MSSAALDIGDAKVTRWLIPLVAISICWLTIGMAQDDLNRDLSRRMAQSLLTRLTSPRGTEFRVGVINTAAEIGVLISPKGQVPRAMFFRGHNPANGSSQLSWLIQDQLDSSARPIRIEVMSTKIDVNNCPELEHAVSGFYGELERLLQTQIPLSELPPVIRSDTLTVDGTTYVFQMWTGAGTILVQPDREIDKAMDEASRILVSSISSCSSDALGDIEEYPVR